MGILEELGRITEKNGDATTKKDEANPPASPPMDPLLGGADKTEFDGYVNDAVSAAQNAMNDDYYDGLSVDVHYAVTVGDWAIDTLKTWSDWVKAKYDADEDKQGQYDRLHAIISYSSLAKSQVTVSS